MGTQIQSKTYFPGHYSMRDLNNNGGNGMWALYYEDKTLKKGQYYDSFSTRQAIDGYFGYDKEQVRQTILKHESIFRHQLQELHRIYRRQRDLMNEFKSRELHKYPMSAETSQSSLSLSHIASEDVKKMWHVSNFPLVDSPFGRPSTSATDCIQSPLSFIKGKSSCRTFPSHDQVCLKDCESLKSKHDMFQRRMFDLELPADVYMENEAKQHEERISGVSWMESNSLNGPNAYLKSTCNLADLNEPILVEETSISASVNNLGNTICLQEDVQMQNGYANSNSGAQFLSKEFSQSSLMVPNNRYSGINRNGKEQLTYNFKAEKNRCDENASLGIYPSHSPKRFKSLQVEPTKAHEPSLFSLSDQHKTAPQGKKTIFGVEISEGNHDQSTDVFHTPSLRSINPESNVVNSESSFVSPWRKNSVTEQFVQLGPTENIKGSVCVDLNSTINLNKYVVAAHVFQNEVVPQQNSVSADEKKTHENPERGLPWLTEKLHSSGEQIKGKEIFYQMSLDSLQNYSQQFFNKAEIKGPTQILIQDSTSPTRAHEFECKKVEIDYQSSRNILGFPIVDAPYISKDRISPSSLSKSSYHASKSDSELEVKDLVIENGLNDYISDLRHHIDLNLSLTEEEAPSVPSLPRAVLKIATTEIDLEAPAVLESEMDISPETECIENQLMLPPELSLDDSREPREELVRVAAEALMAFSSSGVRMSDATCQPLEASPSDCLVWFADVISTYKVREVLIAVDDACDEESIPEGVDYFELMTLQLKDSKEEEYYYEPLILENEREEETRAASLSKRPRRGQARRGRQRKDFQRDILPGLVSLSRHEVTEDLQTIEELFRTSGSNWQSSLSRRKAAKNCRGKRRSVGPTRSLTVTAICPAPIQQQPICRELVLEERSLTGWGKRTRRLPRQRCPTANHNTLALKC